MKIKVQLAFSSGLNQLSKIKDQFLHSGPVPLAKDKIVKVFKSFGDSYSIRFDVKITKDLPNGWTNILHFTTGASHSASGTRIPALFLNGDTKSFHLHHDTKVKNMVEFQFAYKLNQAYHMTLSLQKNKFSWKVNGQEIYQYNDNASPGVFDQVKLYLSDPWYLPLTEYGQLENMQVLQHE